MLLTALKKEIVANLKNNDPEKIILFGSCAFKEEIEDDCFSDIDLIVVKKTELRFLDRIRDAMLALDPWYPVDLLVYTPEEMELMNNSFMQSVKSNMEVLYER